MVKWTNGFLQLKNGCNRLHTTISPKKAYEIVTA
jgi:hypothetical protein